MKEIEGMSRDELIALTSDEVDFLIARECAEHGLKLVPPAPVAPPAPPQKDVTMYEVKGALFATAAEAQAVVNLLNQSRTFEAKGVTYHWNAPEVARPTENEFKISEKMLYSERAAGEHAALLSTHSKMKEAFDAAALERSKAIEARQKAVEYVRDKISDANAEKYKKDRLIERFAEYTRIAGGDKCMAVKFMEKAYGALSNDERRAIGLQEVTEDQPKPTVVVVGF